LKQSDGNDSARHVCCTVSSVVLNPDDALTSLTSSMIGAAITVHRELGPGLMESAYQACLEYELAQLHLQFASQVHVPIAYRDVFIDRGYRVDLLVERSVIVEVKSVEVLAPIHAAQLITYLKLTRCPVALLLNFNVAAMRHGLRRYTNRSAAT
jgi:GxxExxY protein